MQRTVLGRRCDSMCVRATARSPAFLKLVAQRVPDFSYKQAIEAIRRTRPGVNLIECDDPGKNDSTKTRITWKAAYAQR